MEFLEKQIQPARLKGVYRFFCWCSGARLYLLKKCPTDYNVFFGIGMIVFLTGIMASLSGSYAFYTVFNNQWIALGFGIFWGILIFFFDWFLVSSLRKENKFYKEFLMASPRLVLAIFLAVVISRPLELKLFESEINGQIEKMNQQEFNQYKSLVSTSFNEIDQLSAQNKLWQDKVNQLFDQRNVLFNLLIEEAEGRSPVNAVGKGPVYREKKAEYDKINQIYEEEKNRLYPMIDANNKKIAQLSEKKSNRLEDGGQLLRSATGFLARINAYRELGAENAGIKYTGLFILLMFICIETGPIFVKLISKRGAYDELINLEETKSMAQSQQELVLIREKTNRFVELEKHKSKMRLEEEIENNRDFTKMVLQAQAEIATERIRKWKVKEMTKVDDALADYKPTLDELIEEAKIAMKPN